MKSERWTNLLEKWFLLTDEEENNVLDEEENNVVGMCILYIVYSQVDIYIIYPLQQSKDPTLLNLIFPSCQIGEPFGDQP